MVLRQVVGGQLIVSKAPILCPSLESQPIPYDFGVPLPKVVEFTFPLLESQRASELALANSVLVNMAQAEDEKAPE